MRVDLGDVDAFFESGEGRGYLTVPQSERPRYYLLQMIGGSRWRISDHSICVTSSSFDSADEVRRLLEAEIVHGGREFVFSDITTDLEYDWGQDDPYPVATFNFYPKR